MGVSIIDTARRPLQLVHASARCLGFPRREARPGRLGVGVEDAVLGDFLLCCGSICCMLSFFTVWRARGIRVLHQASRLAMLSVDTTTKLAAPLRHSAGQSYLARYAQMSCLGAKGLLLQSYAAHR